MVEGRGRVSTLCGSGRKSQKQDAKHACMGWSKWIQKEAPRRENKKIGRRRGLGGISEGRKGHGF